MTTLLIAALVAVKFNGGTPSEFIAAIADATKQNVVMAQGDGKSIPPAEFETSDLDVMSRAIRTQTKHAILPGNEMVLSDQMLSRRLVQTVQFRGGEDLEGQVRAQLMERVQAERLVRNQPESGANLSLNIIGIPGSAAKDGKVTFKTEKSDAIKPEYLGGIASKPVKVHWIYKDSPIFVNVNDMPELDFMKYVAKAIGARLVAAKEYDFQLDPIEVRKRAIATINAAPVRSGPRADDAEEQKAKNFRIACLNALNAGQLSQMLESAGSSITVQLIPRSPLTSLALQRVKDLEQYQRSLPPESPAPRNAVGLLQRVDGSRPATMTVDSRFSVRMDIPVVDQNGRSAGSVRIQ